MSTLLAKIKFVLINDVSFTQYYKVNEEQHTQLKKLSYSKQYHLCSNKNTCSFCKSGFKDITYVDCIEYQEILLTDCNFELDQLLQIIKDQDQLFVDIENKEIEMQEQLKQLNCTISPVNKLRQGGYAMIDDHPCKIVAMATSRD